MVLFFFFHSVKSCVNLVISLDKMFKYFWKNLNLAPTEDSEISEN